MATGSYVGGETGALPRGYTLHDVRHLGRERVIGCWQVGEVIVDPGPASSLPVLLDQLQTEPRAVLLTHIHLDHAAATGKLLERWPRLEVYVHGRGARHLADPSRLLSSATRLYGGEMERLWGEIVPVPAERIRALAGGERVAGFEAIATPGHASHHLCYLDRGSGWLFCGDVAGVRIPPCPRVVMPTLPPDIDAEAWRRSLREIAGLGATVLAPTHFGAFADVERHLEAAAAELDEMLGEAAALDGRAFEASVLGRIAASADEATAAAYWQAAPPSHLYPGLRRYLDTQKPRPEVGRA